MTSNVPLSKPNKGGVIRRAAKKLRLPLVSGTTSVVLLSLCFAVSAVTVMLLGTALHMAPWLRFELVLAIWWLVWIAALAHLLYHGKRISDDHSFHQPRNWFGAAVGGKPTGGTGSRGGGWGWYAGSADAEGCFWVLAILVALVVIVIVAWLLVEIVIPLLAVVLYALIRSMLARVVNDTHHCTGRLGVAFLWGSVWATVYTGPLALVVWVVHLIVQYRAALGG